MYCASALAWGANGDAAPTTAGLAGSIAIGDERRHHRRVRLPDLSVTTQGRGGALVTLLTRRAMLPVLLSTLILILRTEGAGTPTATPRRLPRPDGESADRGHEEPSRCAGASGRPDEIPCWTPG